MRITIDPGSAASVSINMGRRGENVKGAIQTILKKSIFVIEKHAKYYSPVRTGRLRSSIGGGGAIDQLFSTGEKSIEFGETFASIQPTVTYAKFVHRRVPFMMAAAQDSLQEIEKIASDEINKAIK